MSLRSDVERLRDESLAALVETHDYLVYSQRLWRRLGIETTRHRRRLSVYNRATGSKLTEADLPSLVDASVRKHLPIATIQQFTSITEAFLADLVRLWVTAYPFHLRGQLDVPSILKAPDKDAIVQLLVDRYLLDMTAKPPREWFRQLNEVVALGAPTVAEVDAFAEVKATRDVFVHNRGFVPEAYVRKAGPLARGAVGEPLDLPDPYLHDAWQSCEAIVAAVGTAAAGRAST